MIEAGAYYIDIVVPGNCMTGHYNAVYDTIAEEDGYVYEDQWDAVQSQLLPIALQLMQEEVTFMEKLTSYDWPASVQPQVDAVIAEAAEVAYVNETAAKATDFATWANAVVLERDAAAVLRAALGLPTNIGVDVEDVLRSRRLPPSSAENYVGVVRGGASGRPSSTRTDNPPPHPSHHFKARRVGGSSLLRRIGPHAWSRRTRKMA